MHRGVVVQLSLPVNALRREPQMNRVRIIGQHTLCQTFTARQGFFNQPIVEPIDRLPRHRGFDFIPPRGVFVIRFANEFRQPRTHALGCILCATKIMQGLCQAVHQPTVGVLVLRPCDEFARATAEPLTCRVIHEGFLPRLQPRLGRGLWDFFDDGLQHRRYALLYHRHGDMRLRIVGHTLSDLVFAHLLANHVSIKKIRADEVRHATRQLRLLVW